MNNLPLYDDDETELDAELAKAAMGGDHICFYVNVDGIEARVHGNPNMPPETLSALEEMIRKVAEWVQSGDYKSRKAARDE